VFHGETTEVSELLGECSFPDSVGTAKEDEHRVRRDCSRLRLLRVKAKRFWKTHHRKDPGNARRRVDRRR
jgi:hypothetical protein